MEKQTYRYRFARIIPPQDVEETLMLALMAVESLHGPARLRMDVRYRFDKRLRLCEIDASSQVGADLAKIFTGYASRCYGAEAVTITADTSSWATGATKPDPAGVGGLAAGVGI